MTFKCLTRHCEHITNSGQVSDNGRHKTTPLPRHARTYIYTTRMLNIVITQISRKCNLIIAKFQLTGTALKVFHNITFAFEIFTTQTTAKLFVVRVNRLMMFQFKYCTETLCTLTTYIRLHTFMSK